MTWFRHDPFTPRAAGWDVNAYAAACGDEVAALFEPWTLVTGLWTGDGLAAVGTGAFSTREARFQAAFSAGELSS